jgi:tetratricopeptide (TPR) repeat protein
MQKKPFYRFSRTALAVVSMASSVPALVTSVTAGEGGSGLSSRAQREMVRRQEAVSEADTLLNEGREAYAKADFQQAVDKYSQALARLPAAPMLLDRRESIVAHLGDARIALAMEFRKVGKYTEARTLLEGQLAVDPNNLDAKREIGFLDDPIRTNPALTYEHTQFGQGEVTSGVAYITEKLKKIVIPRIDFEDTTVEEAIDFIRLRASELDTAELDPAKKGVNFVIRRPRANLAAPVAPAAAEPGAADALPAAAEDAGSLRVRELRLRNVPLAVALKYICDQTKLRYKVDDFAVTLVPSSESN